MDGTRGKHIGTSQPHGPLNRFFITRSQISAPVGVGMSSESHQRIRGKIARFDASRQHDGELLGKFECGQAVQICFAQFYRSLQWRLHSRQRPQQGGFARAVRSDQADHFCGAQLQVQA